MLVYEQGVEIRNSAVYGDGIIERLIRSIFQPHHISDGEEKKIGSWISLKLIGSLSTCRD
jgi:hypothetical protein